MITAIIQARLNSKRLPRKVLLPIPKVGEFDIKITCLDRVINAVKASDLVNRMCLTTPDVELSHLMWGKWPLRVFHYQGKRDLLAEFDNIAMKDDVIVRITADCPMLVTEEIDRCIDEFLDSEYDLVYNTDESITMDGDGTDVEVFSYKAFELALNNATKEEREHVTLWMRKHLNCKYLPTTLNGCSLNNKEDYERICKLWTEKEEMDDKCQSTQMEQEQAGQT